MTRTHGRCLRGQRRLDPVPHGHWKTSTLVAGLCLTGITAPYVMDGAMTGGIFLQYIKQILAPSLTAGDIVVMDNVATHKVAGIREALWQAIGEAIEGFSRTECLNLFISAGYAT
jgi:hypothetical protein